MKKLLLLISFSLISISLFSFNDIDCVSEFFPTKQIVPSEIHKSFQAFVEEPKLKEESLAKYNKKQREIWLKQKEQDGSKQKE